MPQTRTCTQCGAPLPSEGWEGLCPKCLVRVSLVSLAASAPEAPHPASGDRKSTRLNSSHLVISYAVFCLKKKKWSSHRTVSRNGHRYMYVLSSSIP